MRTGTAGVLTAFIAACALAATSPLPSQAGTRASGPQATVESVQDLGSIASAAEAHAHDQAARLGFRNIRARALALDTRLSLGRCGHKLETFAAPGRGAGRTTVGVRCNAPRPWTLYVPVQVDASVPTIVLREAMPRGSVLSAGDLRIKLQPAASVYGELVSSVASATGKQLRRDTAAGKALKLNMLTDPQAIARGQTTQIVSVVNNIEVVMNGTALSGAGAGETIRIRNNTSGKLLEGVVTEDGRVRVP
jgi:flagella basal body P-ring formation protein FlgA